jgi:tyrosyl-tRNA synthetase
MSRFLPVAEQLAVLERGAVDLHVKAELIERLEESRAQDRPLRVKAGFDPTRPDLHVGHAVLMQKLRQFQELGHTVILLVGEFTAMVGDPTGQNDARPRLSRDDVRAAAKTYTEQAFKILDRDRTEVRSNAEWLETMGAPALVELLAKTTVSRMLERNDFSKRFEEQKPIFQHEFLYPLLQGYDSVALECDIELGGTDQLFNLLMGRDLMPKYGKRAQMVLTMPLLEGTDAKIENGKVVGKKMSKSADNYIGLDEPAEVIFRKCMQIDDDVIFRYFELLSSLSNEAIAALKEDRKSGRNPMEIKAIFGRELCTRLHDADAAERAETSFKAVYSNNAIPDDVPTFSIAAVQGSVRLANALQAAGLVKSVSDGRRLLEQGGVELDQVRVIDPLHALAVGGPYLVRVGSKNRKFARISVTE